MKLNFNKRFVLRAGILILAVGGAAAVESIRPVVDITRDLAARYHGVEAAMEERAPAPEAAAKELAEMRRLYGELRAAYRPFYGGREEDWARFCDESAATAERARAALAEGDRAAASKAIYRLAELREEAHREFRPGLWRRLARVFSRRGS